jgi:hypothetical protein
MLVTLSGIVTEYRDVQHQNADSPIYVTLSGIVADFRESQFSNA